MPSILRRTGWRDAAFACALLALVPSSGRAQSGVVPQCPTVNVPCANCTTAILFWNGVFNSYGQALASAQALADTLCATLPAEKVASLEVGLLYNPNHLCDAAGSSTGICAGDIADSIAQTYQVSVARAYSWLAGLEPLPNGMQESFGNIAAGVEQLNVTSDDVKDFIPAIRAQVKRKRVIIVPHSQGNFYANQAFLSLLLTQSERASIGIISVANPTLSVAGSDRSVTPTPDHVTIEEDRIIRRLIAAGLALNANVTNGQETADSTGHQFIKSYLQPQAGSGRPAAVSGGNIVGLIDHLIDNLPVPRPTQFLFDNLGSRQFCTVTGGSLPSIDCRGQTIGFIDNFFLPDVFFQTVAVPIDIPSGTSYVLSEVEVPVYQLSGPNIVNGVTIAIKPDVGGLPSSDSTLIGSLFGPVKSVSQFLSDPTFTTLRRVYGGTPIVVAGGSRIWVEVSSSDPAATLVWSFTETTSPAPIAMRQALGSYFLTSSQLPALRIVLTPQ